MTERPKLHNIRCKYHTGVAFRMHGMEWIVEAQGCRPAALRDITLMRSLFAAIVHDLDLHPVGETRWHKFPDHAGITGLCLLSESHLAVHTFPEHESLCLNLFCCHPRQQWDFRSELVARFGAVEVNVREVVRPYASGDNFVAHKAIGANP